MDLVDFTVEHSLESESTYHPKCAAHILGLKCELQVIKILTGRGLTLLGQRIRLFGVEVDLLFQSKSAGLILVEVKSLGDHSELEFRLKRRQKMRLKMVYQQLLANEQQVEFILAVVSHDRVHFFDDFL